MTNEVETTANELPAGIQLMGVENFGTDSLPTEEQAAQILGVEIDEEIQRQSCTYDANRRHVSIYSLKGGKEMIVEQTEKFFDAAIVPAGAFRIDFTNETEIFDETAKIGLGIFDPGQVISNHRSADLATSEELDATAENLRYAIEEAREFVDPDDDGTYISAARKLHTYCDGGYRWEVNFGDDSCLFVMEIPDLASKTTEEIANEIETFYDTDFDINGEYY